MRVCKLPLRFSAFSVSSEGVVRACLQDANGVEVASGPLQTLLGRLPVKRSKIANLTFAAHCVNKPEAATFTRPFHLRAAFGHAGRGQDHALSLRVVDDHDVEVLAADVMLIEQAVLECGYEISASSLAQVRKMIRGMRPYQRLVGGREKKLPAGIAKFRIA